jgi:hypothetical protein
MERRFQFGLKNLLWAMTWVAVWFGAWSVDAPDGVLSIIKLAVIVGAPLAAIGAMRGSKKWLQYSAGGVYYVFLLIGALLWLTVVLPAAFLTEFSVTNNTGETIWITPIGTVGSEGSRHLLPLYRQSFPFFLRSKVGHFPVAPGSTLYLTYDFDDINFSEVVIETEAGTTGQVVVNPNPTANQYTVPALTDIVVTDLDALSPVASNVLDAAASGRHLGQAWLMYIVFGIPLLIAAIRIIRNKWRRRRMLEEQTVYV